MRALHYVNANRVWKGSENSQDLILFVSVIFHAKMNHRQGKHQSCEEDRPSRQEQIHIAEIWITHTAVYQPVQRTALSWRLRAKHPQPQRTV